MAIIIFTLRYIAHFSLGNLFLIIAILIGGSAAIFFMKKLPRFNKKANGTFIVLSIILFISIFAPLIATYGPNSILNAGECKLLPPFSKKMILFYSYNGPNENEFEIIVADSFKIADKITAYKKNRIIELDGKNAIKEGGVPKIEKAFFLLGTDELGRDLFSRLIYGARLSLTIGFSAAFASIIIASFFAFISISRFKFIDMLTNRISEIFLAIPSLFIIIFAISLFGNNLFAVIMALAVTSWVTLFKILNGEVKRIINKNFIVSSRMLGIAKNKIFLKEIIPLILPSLIVNLIFQIANFIIIEASLSFLGLGPGGDYVSWGGIIESGITYLSVAWWLILFPGALLFFTIAALNKTGNKLEKYFNPLLK